PRRSPADRSCAPARSSRATARWRCTGGPVPPDTTRAATPQATRIEMQNVVAIYPGSFDPLTNGHVDIIRRGARLFDRIVVAVLINLEQAPLFTVPERVEIAREAFTGTPNVEVDTFDGLLVDYARKRGAGVIVKGLRAVSDFEFEMQMALMNRQLNPADESA